MTSSEKSLALLNYSNLDFLGILLGLLIIIAVYFYVQRDRMRRPLPHLPFLCAPTINTFIKTLF